MQVGRSRVDIGVGASTSGVLSVTVSTLALLLILGISGCVSPDSDNWGRVNTALSYRELESKLDGTGYGPEILSAIENLEGKLARYYMKDRLIGALRGDRWILALELSAVVGTYYSFICIEDDGDDWLCSSSMIPGEDGFNPRSEDIWVARISKSAISSRLRSDLLDAPRDTAGVWTMSPGVTGGGDALLATEIACNEFYQSVDYGFDVPWDAIDSSEGPLSRPLDSGLRRIHAAFAVWRAAYAASPDSRVTITPAWK